MRHSVRMSITKWAQVATGQWKAGASRIRSGSTLTLWLCMAISLQADVVLPSLSTNLACFYDFDHPTAGDSAQEEDLGFSGTAIDLVNGGETMRTNDGARPGSVTSLQTQQQNPAANGNDDWKAGVYSAGGGVPSLGAFSSVTGTTLMGWVKPTGANPSLNSNTANSDDYYNAVGLFGVLSGGSDGHNVRALLEVINVSGTLRLVALGRRVDTGNSLILAATEDWQTLLPSNTWTHVTATFNFDNGTMALYRNGVALNANYTSASDRWNVIGALEPDLTSVTAPAGIKIGGSYPQNTAEKNSFNGQFDDLMFFNKSLSASEVQLQYAALLSGAAPSLTITRSNQTVIVSWPDAAGGYQLESTTNLLVDSWTTVPVVPVTNGGSASVTVPITGARQFIRLRSP